VSEPSIDNFDSLQGAMSELISAISALNMEAAPISGATGYLSDTDEWARHATKHLHAVAVLLNQVGSERDGLRADLMKLKHAVRVAVDLAKAV
jgi:hypothetical protein